MKQLFVVTIESEVVVVADSADHAAELADGIRVSEHDPTVSAQPMTFMPAGFDDDAIPFGDEDPEDPDRTVGEWIERGAAPEYVRLNERLRRAKP